MLVHSIANITCSVEGRRGWSATRDEMCVRVTRDENQHLIIAPSAKVGLPFARAASSTGLVMRSTTLLLLAAAAAASAALDQQQFLPNLCRNKHPRVFVDEALMLNLWPEPQHPASDFANCSVRLLAPDGHYLAIAYHSSDNKTDQCPIRLDLAYKYYKFPVKVENLCMRQWSVQSLLPNMYAERATLEVYGTQWAPEGHKLHVTAVGINDVCANHHKYYPCAMMNTQPSPMTLSRYCVRQSVVCDGWINCPASGADEIGMLCNSESQATDEDGSSLVTKQLRELTEQVQLEIYNSAQTAEEEFSWWWYLAATCLSVVLLVTGVAVAAYCRNTNQDESDSETTGMSMSCPESCPEREDPPPDYKSIFPCEEPV